MDVQALLSSNYVSALTVISFVVISGIVVYIYGNKPRSKPPAPKKAQDKSATDKRRKTRAVNNNNEITTKKNIATTPPPAVTKKVKSPKKPAAPAEKAKSTKSDSKPQKRVPSAAAAPAHQTNRTSAVDNNYADAGEWKTVQSKKQKKQHGNDALIQAVAAVASNVAGTKKTKIKAKPGKRQQEKQNNIGTSQSVSAART